MWPPAVGMSAAGLYQHFADKEAMFAALVEPVLQKCNMWYETHKTRDYELLDSDNLEEMWASDADLTMMMELVYTNFDEFKLLLCCSEGTHYAHFLHELVLSEQRETEAFYRRHKNVGFQ